MNSLINRLQNLKEQTQMFKEDQEILWEILESEAKKTPETPPESRLPTNEVPGCVSRLWWTHQVQDGVIQCTSYSDALITRTLAGIMASVLNGLHPQESEQLSINIILDTIGLDKSSLSPRRFQTLENLIQKITNKN
jgi:cysteine desulfuration protein SufE